MTVFCLVLCLIVLLVWLWYGGGKFLAAMHHAGWLGANRLSSEAEAKDLEDYKSSWRSFVSEFPNGAVVLDSEVYYSPLDYKKATELAKLGKPLPLPTSGSELEFKFWTNLLASEEAAKKSAGKTSSNSKSKTTTKSKSKTESQASVLAKMKGQSGDRKLNTEVTSL